MKGGMDGGRKGMREEERKGRKKCVRERKYERETKIGMEKERKREGWRKEGRIN